jgi:uncharacterized protein (DUF488 family)
MGRYSVQTIYDMKSRMVLYTIGHSIHPIETFLGLLSQHQIATLVDVRSFPGSRKWPQFNREELKASVEQAGLSYEWYKDLGGRRHSPLSDSPHTAWQHPAFRSCADYADTTEFSVGIEKLSELAGKRRSAIMCSEGLWWRCHRRIVADYLTVRGWEIRHIMPNGKLAAHSLPAFARVNGTRIIYDGKPE